MKNKYITASLIAFSFLLGACSQDDIDRYDTSYVALNIGFGNISALTNKTTYNYSETSGEKGVKFLARVSGVASDQDRSFTLEITDGDIDKVGNSIRVEEYVIPAGEISGEFQVYFDTSKLPDPDAFSDEEGEIVLMMTENNYFNLGASKQNELRITLKNGLSMPETWNSAVYPQQALRNTFGTYSPEKHTFMIENGMPTNFRISSWQTEQMTQQDGYVLLSTLYASYMKSVLIDALDKYNATHDTPLSDSQGNPITF